MFYISIIVAVLSLTVSKNEANIQVGECVIAPMSCPNPNITYWLYTRETQNNPHELNVDYPESLINAKFVKNVETIILIHGYTGHRDYAPNPEIRPAYFQHGEYNIISPDYNPLAREPCYMSAVVNVQVVGKCIAQLMDELIGRNIIRLYSIHVVGFSLGAQISGAIANYLQSGKLERITGLDPAMPLFTHPDNGRKLDSSDAKFVDIIHTNAMERGKLEPTGHTDFYVNGGVIQPGCDKNENNMSRSSCSHWRAPVYYAESINSDIGFYGKKCGSWTMYLLGWCMLSDDEEEIMGEYTPNSARGLWFVETNSEAPYAKGRSSDQHSNNEKSETMKD